MVDHRRLYRCGGSARSGAEVRAFHIAVGMVIVNAFYLSANMSMTEPLLAGVFVCLIEMLRRDEERKK